MDTTELGKSDQKDATSAQSGSHILVELIEYEHNAVVSKTIMKRSTGSINAMSFADGEGLNERTSTSATYAQVIDGSAVVVIDGKATKLGIGEGIVIPANTPNYTEPNGRFKMLLTVIKGDEEQ
jgi:quercetin dioxygenase-like cupin family protein